MKLYTFFFLPVQTITCHELRQQLVERYLESNFEIPCCSLCKSNSTKVVSTCQLSLQKLCNYHVHQRPLVVTQNIGDDDVMYYADEETGERIIIEPIQEVNSVRRHCTSCSQRIRLQPEHCEELVFLLLCLLQSLIQCPYPRKFCCMASKILLFFLYNCQSLKKSMVWS